MQSLKTKLLIKSLIGGLLGMFISLILFAINISHGAVINDAFHFVTQFIGSFIMGAICMGSSTVYDIESWGLVKVTVIHYAIALFTFLITSILLKWFNSETLIIAVIIYSVAYVIIWLLEYLIWKKEIRNMNRDLKNVLSKSQGR